MTQRLDIDQPFDLDAVLDGTQDFRWRPWECDWHSGVVNGNLIHIRQVSGGVEYKAAAELDALVRSYFRLDDNIPAMRAELSARMAGMSPGC